MTPAGTSAEPGSPRCFLALLPDVASRDVLRDCRDKLEGTLAGAARGVRWIDATSLHLTLRFLGDTTSAQTEYLKHMLPTLACALPALAARRHAIWPNRARPRLLVLELDAPDALVELARACEILARKAEFEPEPRQFKAHLTLARLRPGCAREIPSVRLPALTFESLALMSSNPRTGGAHYHTLASVALDDAQNF